MDFLDFILISILLYFLLMHYFPKTAHPLILFFMPHPLNGYIRRKLGQNIDSTSKIHIFSFIQANSIQIGKRTTISPLTIIRCHQLLIGNYSHIAPLSIINAPLIQGANFSLGNHSRIFPFCWLEPGEGIQIGNHVGIGGHSLIFTHGSWSNYLNGGPVSFGPVSIGDNTWLPWRVFVMPNIRIGENCIIGANSTVTSNVESNSLAAGSPIKILKQNINQLKDKTELLRRIETLNNEYLAFSKRCERTPIDLALINYSSPQFQLEKNPNAMIEIDIDGLTFIDKLKNSDSSFLISFLRRYGIRLQDAEL